MEAIITIVIKDVEEWGDYENSTMPEIEADIKDAFEQELNGELGYDKLEVEVK